MQQRLSTSIGQRLVFTPKLAQSLKILAMNAEQLDGYIADCLESNPLLEQDTETEDKQVPAQTLQRQDTGNDWHEAGDERWYTMYTQSSKWHGNLPDIQLQARRSIEETLHEQVGCQPLDEDKRHIAHAIIDTLDEGYFLEAPEELARSLNLSPRDIIDVLEQIVQKLSPAGIGARNLKECLVLQLDENEKTDRLARELLLHYTEHLFDDDTELANISGQDITAIKAARSRLRRLDPYPGRTAADSFSIYVRPEVIFQKQPDGSIRIEVPDYSWHGLRLTDKWQGYVWQEKDKAFMSHATREATWLMHALEQRRKTLYKVARCLAKRQKRFLEYGPIGLKPLTLQEVAVEVGLHESTISRVTHGKYAQTPLGLVEMKRFFSGSLPVRGGGTIAVYRVQQRIKALIESEPPSYPIADQKISEVLQSEGVKIARRTVAKYREQLGFPPSHQRKHRVRSVSLKYHL